MAACSRIWAVLLLFSWRVMGQQGSYQYQLFQPHMLLLRPMPWYVPSWKFPAVPPPPATATTDEGKRRKLFARPAAADVAGPAIVENGQQAASFDTISAAAAAKAASGNGEGAERIFKSYFPTSMQRSLEFYQPRDQDKVGPQMSQDAGQVEKGPFNQWNDPWGFKKQAWQCGSLFTLDQAGLLKHMIRNNEVDYSWVMGKKDLAPLLAMGSYIFLEGANPFDTWPSIFMLLATFLLALNIGQGSGSKEIDCNSLRTFQTFRGVDANNVNEATQSLIEYYTMWRKMGKQPTPADFKQFYRDNKLTASGFEREHTGSVSYNNDPTSVDTDAKQAEANAAASEAASAAKKASSDAVNEGLGGIQPLKSSSEQEEDEEDETPPHTLKRQHKKNNNCRDPVGLQRHPGLLDGNSKSANPFEALDACVVM